MDNTSEDQSLFPRPPYWHSRGYLPHFEDESVVQHVTLRLSDSLPRHALTSIDEDPKALPETKRSLEKRRRFEAYLDSGLGSCILRHPTVAGLVQETLLFHRRQRYDLFAWVIMPNHVHALFQSRAPWTVARIVASWKKFSAHKILDFARTANLPVGVPVWHREYFDRYVRNDRHYANTVEYIHNNPVNAKLVAYPDLWRWSSAYPESAHLTASD